MTTVTQDSSNNQV